MRSEDGWWIPMVDKSTRGDEAHDSTGSLPEAIPSPYSNEARQTATQKAD